MVGRSRRRVELLLGRRLSRLLLMVLLGRRFGRVCRVVSVRLVVERFELFVSPVCLLG